MAYFWVHKKIHWSDCDAAGVVWFPNFLGWFEDAEEELYAAVLGQTRQSLLDGLRFGMPRVEVSIKYRAPVRAGQLVRIGIASTLEHARRLRHAFEIREDASGTLLADGFVRVACVDLATFTPRDFPEPVVRLARDLPAAIERQEGGASLPWV